MIPSDHFVYFYNEVFKEIAQHGPVALDRYYARVAERQANFTLDAFRREGLRGVRDYYERIRIEENCELGIDLTDDFVRLKMTRCPSLSKALESDAGACPVYCDQCPGWCLRVYSAAGLYEVYDLMSRTKPVCDEWIYVDREKARRKYEELLALRGPDLVKTNIDTTPPYLANRIADSARFEWMHPNLKAAFRFLRETDLKALRDGRIEIDGGRVYANVMAAKLSPFADECLCEAHRNWIDIQVPLDGEEVYGTHTANERDLASAYDSRTDCTFFRAHVEPLSVRPGEFVAFFPPYGGHAVAMARGKDARPIRKVVVKVSAKE